MPSFFSAVRRWMGYSGGGGGGTHSTPWHSETILWEVDGDFVAPEPWTIQYTLTHIL